jgi:hypothetical protein
MRVGDLIQMTVTRCDLIIEVTARSGGQAGHGQAPNTGTLGLDLATLRAVRDLKRKLNGRPAE